MSFMTKNSLPVRSSSVVTLLRVEYQREYASIYAFGSDGARRVAKVHNFETVQLARDLYRKAKDLIGSKVIFNAAGGNDPSRWFFSIDEVIEDPADIEQELIAADHQFEEEDFDPTHSDPNWVVCDEPIQEDILGLQATAEDIVRTKSIAESTIHCARLVSSLNFFLGDSRDPSKFEWMDLRSGFRVQKALLEDVNNDFELSDLLHEKISILDEKIASFKNRKG